ncbi:oxidoreductase [Gaoshiqia sp. Z1-71]|uniref:oxidoreductase n=1 Tax=Gaoshiqia hydrogeniformans TaxID=3290090 RepID=UPI003BF8FDE2
MGKVVFVTGASSGIGRETARLLVQQGYIVYGASRRMEKMQDLKEAGVHLLEMDVTNEASVSEGIRGIMDAEHRIDILINNAGYGSYGAVEDVPMSEAKYQFDVNLFGPAHLIQLVLPQMRERKAGRIINISSMGGKFGEPHGAWYHATKYALEGFSDCLRMELKQFGIDVVIIQPGAIKTEWDVVAGENLANVSGHTAYKDSASKHIRLLARVYRRGSEPVVVARVIVKAIRSKKPKTRYTAGTGAKLILFLRKILSDKLFDRIMLGQLR